MKKYFLLISVAFVVLACGEDPKTHLDSESNDTAISSSSEEEKAPSKEELEASLEQLGGILNMGKEKDGDSSPETEALKKLLEMAGTQGKGDMDSFQEMITTEGILSLLEANGVSRSEMEKLINNPDSLKILAQEAIKKREELRQDEEEIALANGNISRKQLASKNTKTGVSIEEAILLVQAESGPEATKEKLKLIDSLAGTNVMEQLDIKEAEHLFKRVERKNEPKASTEEEKKMNNLKWVSRQMHSHKESIALLAELKQTEEDIASGKIKASPKYARTITNIRKKVKIYSSDFGRKSKLAMKKFQQLNPDLYFGEEAGNTYVGSGGDRTAVYLPLGKLAFADKVVSAHHPKLQTKDRFNVIGEPDVLEYGYEVGDVSGMYSLGLAGDLTIQFIDNALTDVNGPDLYIFEFGAIEPTDLEISKDGKKWIKVGKIDGGVAEVDISEFVKKGELFYYVRLKDLEGVSSLPGADIDAIGAIGAAMRLNLDSKVLFETGKATLKPEGIEALRELANSISILKRGSVIVEGHTDDVGSTETNQKLSLARAKSVSTELRKLIPGKGFRWRERGLGESKPLVENDSDENRARNRRVEILVVPN